MTAQSCSVDCGMNSYQFRICLCLFSHAAGALVVMAVLALPVRKFLVEALGVFGGLFSLFLSRPMSL